MNEARLSSLAICIYLASISVYSENVDDDTLKVLYLDNVFIGLDTSNRFPIFEIIKKEFIDKDKFQIFISTYDRELFELSRHWFETKKCKIKAMELFIEDNENPNKPDYPVIIPTSGNLEKAKAYFKAKDYTVSGNYLRKECESLLYKILPKTYSIDNEGAKIKDFEKLLHKLEAFLNECKIAKFKDLIRPVKIYRKSLLNPSSHSDLQSPIFKKELQTAFEIVEKLFILISQVV